MTAPPPRHRSQNAESAPLREAGSSRAPHLRSLPPTLFKLRNLNSPPPTPKVIPSPEATTSSQLTVSALATNSTKQESQPHTAVEPPRPVEALRVDSGEANTEPVPRRGIISRLSNQSVVLFIVLAIAITGIIVGNRGSHTDQTTADASQQSDDASLANAAGEANPQVPSMDAVVAGAIAPQAATENAEPLVPDTTGVGQSAASGHTQPTTSLASASLSSSSPSITQPDSNSELGTPLIASDAALSGNSTTTDVGTASLGTPKQALANPAADLASADQAAPSHGNNITSADSTSSITHRLQTQTPTGIDDWSRYLPSVQPSTVDAGTVAAVSQTPESPITSYQQYLDGMPNLGQTTAPVGYTADPTQYNGASTLNTQSPLPSSISPSLQR